MCGERLQRILMAIMLGLTMYFFALGREDQTMFQIGVVLQTFIIIMLLIFAFTNFCPSLWFFNKVFGKCEWEKKESE
ncbi:MAG: phosphoribosylaminoimidazole synthetase [Epsilonproteobacteria bacterium]|nr:phosphoribosylaminoimidazole synthetase [Campylobacterota bacterium]NPA56336.1 phosphoribosylaminoimidazole synthetase [Campylobacterota bacterium]